MTSEQPHAHRESVYHVTGQERPDTHLNDSMLLAILREHDLSIQAIGNDLHVIHPDAKPLTPEVKRFCQQQKASLWRLAKKRKGGNRP